MIAKALTLAKAVCSDVQLVSDAEYDNQSHLFGSAIIAVPVGRLSKCADGSSIRGCSSIIGSKPWNTSTNNANKSAFYAPGTASFGSSL